MTTNYPSTSNYYAWRMPAIYGDSRVLIAPHADPMEHETPFDFMFASPDDANDALVEYELEVEALRDEWVLVHVTQTVVDGHKMPLESFVYHATHVSKYDGSPIMIDEQGRAWNECGDKLDIDPSEWDALSPYVDTGDDGVEGEYPWCIVVNGKSVARFRTLEAANEALTH